MWKMRRWSAGHSGGQSGRLEANQTEPAGYTEGGGPGEQEANS